MCGGQGEGDDVVRLAWPGLVDCFTPPPKERPRRSSQAILSSLAPRRPVRTTANSSLGVGFRLGKGIMCVFLGGMCVGDVAGEEAL